MQNNCGNKTILGVMTGTSMDGIDMAVLTTDGKTTLQPGPFASRDFSSGLRDDLRAILDNWQDKKAVQTVEDAYSIEAGTKIQQFINNINDKIDYIALHGQTIYHAPKDKITMQIGNAEKIANMLKIPVIYDFRSNDIHHGGEGAPLAPAYHLAIAKQVFSTPYNVAFVNIGGVANITYIQGGDGGGDNMLAFDCGPGNALMDDILQQKANIAFDKDGKIASGGLPKTSVIQEFLQNDFFKIPPPKSLDRKHFHVLLKNNFVKNHDKLADIIATLCHCTAMGIAESVKNFCEKCDNIILCGGGRHNKYLYGLLESHPALKKCKISIIDDFSFNGDMLEAEAFAYLAMRHLKKLPLSWPSTTGVSHPVTGGKIIYPSF